MANNNEKVYKGIIDQYGTVDNYYTSSQFTNLDATKQGQIKNILGGMKTPIQTQAPVTPVAPVAQSTTQAPVQATLPQQTTVAPVQPVATQTPVDNSVVFGQQASAKQALDTTYLDKRNDTIAQQTIDQLNSIANQGQKVDATTRDSIMEGLIAKAGGQVQWDNPDRQNTIDQINTKVLQQTGAKDWNTAFSTLNKPYSQITQYTNGESLAKALDSGLVSSSQLQNIKQYNPQVYNEYVAKRDADANLALVNLSKPTASTLVADKGIDVSQLFQSLGLDMTKSADIDLVAKRQELYSTGEVKASQEAYLKDKKDLEALQDTYMNIEDDVRAEYEGTGVTESFIMAKVANRQKPLYKQLQTQQRNYSNSLEAMQLAMGNAKDELDIYTQQAQLDRQETMDKLQVGQFAYGIMADQQAREDKYKLADIQFQQEKDMLAYKYDMEYGDINSSDPRVQQRYFDRISEDFVKQYEGLVKSTPQQLSARIKADVLSGKTIGQAMGAIMEDLKKNEYYGAYIKKKAGVDDKPFEIGGRVYKIDGNGDVIQIGNNLEYDIQGGVNGNSTIQTDSIIPGNIYNPNYRNKAATPAVRNNNPGNITDLGFGGTRVEGERFTVFETPQQGFQALVSKIQNIQNGGSKTYSAGMTLTQFFGKYAPSSDNNNPDQYAISVANRLGVTANTTVGQVDPVKLAWEISRHEDVNMYNLLKSGATTAGSASGGAITLDQIMIYNDPVARRKMTSEELRIVGEARAKVMSDPNASIADILKWSTGGNPIGQTQSQQFVKFDNAMGMLSDIQAQIDKQKTGPIIGALRGLNPYDTDAQVLKASLQGLIPTMARGVYGEVGVLTDNDIRLYTKTLPSLKSTKEINEGVLSMTLDVLAGGYKRMLTSLAGQGYNVSGLEGTYYNIQGQANTLRQKLGMPPKTETTTKPQPSSRSSAFSTLSSSTSPLQGINNSIAGYLNAMGY